MYSISYINFWPNNGNVQDRWITNFIENNIGIKLKETNSGNQSDILVASCFGDKKNIEKYHNSKLKIFFYGENLERYPSYNNFEWLASFFDIIIGFKYTDKKNKIYRLPLWMTYYPFYNMNGTNNIISYIETSYSENLLKTKKMCALISRHDRGGQRTKIYNQVIKYREVFCPGKFKKNCAGIDNKVSSKLEFLKKFETNICPENSKSEGYYTEKIFQSLECGCIPIYWAIDKPENNILNEDCYCFVNIENVEDCENKIKFLFENIELFKVKNVFKPSAQSILNTYYNEIIYAIKEVLC
jgi:hypothetical protein